MAKEKKHTGTNKEMDTHIHSILEVLNRMNSNLESLVYYQQPSRGHVPQIQKALAQQQVHESKKLEDKIEKLVIEELRKLNEENK